MVEVKSGETYNGILSNCDVWMNLHLVDIVSTSQRGDKFYKMKECFIRGNTIKYLRVPEEIADKVKDHAEKKRQRNSNQSNSSGKRSSKPKSNFTEKKT